MNLICACPLTKSFPHYDGIIHHLNLVLNCMLSILQDCDDDCTREIVAVKALDGLFPYLLSLAGPIMQINSGDVIQLVAETFRRNIRVPSMIDFVRERLALKDYRALGNYYSYFVGWFEEEDLKKKMREGRTRLTDTFPEEGNQQED